MVVLVIIGLLATLVIINVMPAADRAAMTKARADIATLEQGIECTGSTISATRPARKGCRRWSPANISAACPTIRGTIPIATRAGPRTGGRS